MVKFASLPRLIALAAIAVAALLLGGTARADDSSRTRLLVHFNEGFSKSSLANLDLSGMSVDDSVPDLGVDVVSVPSDNTNAALSTLRAMSGVAYAEVDAVVPPAELLPNDPNFPQTFALNGGAWGWYKTHTTQAWDVTRGSSSVVVAVLDTGLKTQGLNDYNGQVVSGYNVITHTSDVSTTAGNHGTEVAGVIGLGIDNGTGNAGFCPGCKIMPVLVGSDVGANLSDIASGITWATDHGAKVINLSWASTVSSTTLTNAVSYARSHGVLVVAAAGNTGCDCPNYPAATPGVLSVASSLLDDSKAGYSNYGSWVKVAAPGTVMTSWAVTGQSQLPGYGPQVGTSIASPVVAGIAGLLFSAAPSATVTQVENALESSATHVGFTVQYGRVDAMAALQALGQSDPQPTSAPVNSTAPQVRLESYGNYDSVPLTSAPQPGQTLLRGQGTWTGSAPLSLTAVQWNKCDLNGANCIVAGSGAIYTVQGGDVGYRLGISVTVANNQGAVTTQSALSAPVFDPSAPPPTAPVNTSPPAVSGVSTEGLVLSASTGSWNGSPTSYTYQWQRCNASGSSCANVSGATNATYTLVTDDVGSTMRTVVAASNSAGQSTATSPSSNVVAPQHPTAVTFRSLVAKRTKHGVVVIWGTASELGTVGYNVYRGSGTKRVKLNKSLIKAGLGVWTRSYSLLDRSAKHGTYWVEAVERNGARVLRGPASAR
jgi:thermitase